MKKIYLHHLPEVKVQMEQHRSLWSSFLTIVEEPVHADAIWLKETGLDLEQVRNWKLEDKIIACLFREGESLTIEPRLIDFLMADPLRTVDILNFTKFLMHAELKPVLLDAANKLDLVSATVEESVHLMQRLQRDWSPNRFSGLKGFRVQARHLSGLRPGGDFFDLFESKNKDALNLLLADSSNYGISSAFLGMLLSAGAKIADDQDSNSAAAVSKWIQAIIGEIQSALGENGYLNLFFGRINRRDFTLDYQMFGSVESYIVSQEGHCTRLKHDGFPISKTYLPAAPTPTHSIPLHPKDRIVLLSDGFVNAMGGEVSLREVFKKKLDTDPFELVDHLTFEVKRKCDRQQEFLSEDCTAIVIDVESRILRLAAV